MPECVSSMLSAQSRIDVAIQWCCYSNPNLSVIRLCIQPTRQKTEPNGKYDFSYKSLHAKRHVNVMWHNSNSLSKASTLNDVVVLLSCNEHIYSNTTFMQKSREL
jgi:hypothetical protein